MAMRNNKLSERHYSKKVREIETLTNEGKRFLDRGDIESALMFYKNAFDACVELYGENSDKTAVACNNVAVAYSKNYSYYSNALTWHEKTAAIREQTLGPQHASTAASYNNIATIYRSLNDHDTALEWYCKAYISIYRALGGTNENTMIVYGNLRKAYISAGGSVVDFPEWLRFKVNYM